MLSYQAKIYCTDISDLVEISSELISSANIGGIGNLKYCTNCKMNCDRDQFSDHTGKVFATCSGCRDRVTSQRYPQIIEQKFNNQTSFFNEGKLHQLME